MGHHRCITNWLITLFTLTTRFVKSSLQAQLGIMQDSFEKIVTLTQFWGHWGYKHVTNWLVIMITLVRGKGHQFFAQDASWADTEQENFLVTLLLGTTTLERSEWRPLNYHETCIYWRSWLNEKLGHLDTDFRSPTRVKKVWWIVLLTVKHDRNGINFSLS